MDTRPALNRDLDPQTFREYYWLKEELKAFCRVNRLPASGGKQELTERIARFLETGEIRKPEGKQKRKKPPAAEITRETILESPFVCTEAYRAFFKKEIGNTFSFNVPFQQWLNSHAGLTCEDALNAYREILAQKKKETGSIGKQFEYNTYIRDFFANNPGKTLADAIRCWKYKKSRKGNHRYEPEDRKALAKP